MVNMIVGDEHPADLRHGEPDFLKRLSDPPCTDARVHQDSLAAAADKIAITAAAARKAAELKLNGEKGVEAQGLRFYSLQN